MSPRRSTRNKRNVITVESENDVQSEEPPKKKTKTKKEKPAEPKEREVSDTETEGEAWKNVSFIYKFTAKDINGEEVSLEKYKGHVCIIVNVASRCGHTTSNYEGFNKLFASYADEKGLRILAFPCNQFASQEPGDNKRICEFIKKKNVKFDVFEKIDVNGKNAHPLWKFMKEKITGPKGPNINWNFTKFIIDKEGKVVERFKPTVKPLQLVEHLEKYW